MDPYKAVLCDDDRVSSLILKRLLEKAGFLVSTAANGKEGLERIRADKPQLLVLDLDMPVKNGFQVLEDLKAAKDMLPYTLVLTAHESAEDDAQVKSLGAKGMVIKPFNPAELIKKLQTLAREGHL